MRILLILSLTSLLVSIAMAQQVHALDRANIAVSAEATVEALPDFINLGIEVSKTAENREQAKQQADKVVGGVLGVLSNLKINENDFRASDISSRPEYQYENNKRRYKGEQVTRTVTVKLRNLSAYTTLVDQLLKLDITRYYQNGSGFDNAEDYQNQALIKALKKARSKAEVIAETIDRDIDKVFQVSESSMTPMPRGPFVEMAMAKSASGAAQDAPLEIKPQQIDASVNVIFLLK